mmetsp:Transcript_15036/g.33517  ORF Transcript_15036/g.33517 Transcript_15036/m.33517 type:complete len:588 (-) Transcript_15036:533-2296(-)
MALRNPESSVKRRSFSTKILILIGAIWITSIFSLFLTHGRLERLHVNLHLSRLDAGGLAKLGRKIEDGITDGAIVHSIQNFVTHIVPAEENNGGAVKRDGDEILPGARTKHKKGRPVSRGFSGLPLTQTPAVLGAERGHINCEVDVDSLAYWNHPRGKRDAEFVSEYRVPEGETRYITFEPDSGGWNNIRMSMEIIFVMAVVTGRTLVLPPDQPLYLLHHDKNKRGRGFADFYPLDNPGFKQYVTTISTEEYLKREGGKNGRLPMSDVNAPRLTNIKDGCEKRKKSDRSCFSLYDHLREVGTIPEWKANDHCLIFDKGEMTDAKDIQIKKFCGNRKPVYYNETLQNAITIHFSASIRDYRLLNHFYAFIFFTDPVVDNFYKRFVRDYLHYKDSIFCAAGKIVNALQKESIELGFNTVDNEGAGGYSSLHVRRGDLQYKHVKISAEEWYENTKDIWMEDELLYIATDEGKKEFFDPIKKHHKLRFLDDYMDIAGLKEIDPNYMGMVDTIVASRGRMFAGTYLSTFTGFITRMRGYYGFLATASWYGMKNEKTKLHKWAFPHSSYFAREFPIGWAGIDGDAIVSGFLVS